jgi:group I intron endonuclease
MFLQKSKNQLAISNMVINKALLKHDISNFSLEILEYCEPENAVSREQYYIDLLNPEYNILRKAGSSLGFKHSEQTRAKMSAPKSEATRTKLSALNKGKNNPMFGKTQSEETRAQMSASHMGRKRSEEDKANISASKMGNSYGKNQPNALKIQVTDLELNTKTTYNSIRAAARALNINYGVITTYFRRNQQKPFRGRYVFTKIT